MEKTGDEPMKYNLTVVVGLVSDDASLLNYSLCVWLCSRAALLHASGPLNATGQ